MIVLGVFEYLRLTIAYTSSAYYVDILPFRALSMSRSFIHRETRGLTRGVFLGLRLHEPAARSGKTGSRSIKVNAAPVTSKEVRRIVQSVGTLFPFDEGVISAEIEGRVAEVNADLGDRVTKGRSSFAFPMKSRNTCWLRPKRSCVWRWSASDFGTRTIG